MDEEDPTIWGFNRRPAEAVALTDLPAPGRCTKLPVISGPAEWNPRSYLALCTIYAKLRGIRAARAVPFADTGTITDVYDGWPESLQRSQRSVSKAATYGPRSE